MFFFNRIMQFFMLFLRQGKNMYFFSQTCKIYISPDLICIKRKVLRGAKRGVLYVLHSFFLTADDSMRYDDAQI